MAGDFIGEIISAGSDMSDNVFGAVTTMYNANEAEKALKRQMEHERYLQRQEKIQKLPAGTGGVVPGIANPYMLALGGLAGENLDPNHSLTEYNTGGLHEENPHGGIPLGVGSNGKPNTVEEGETSYLVEGKKYVFSNRLIV